ncbi:MAG TPA: type II toxin-antitoxin system prevent-host-death family antitoxin [Terriglobia bacterium]|jgi:prevent-host-death family protein
MAISITVLKNHCLAVIREVERTGKPVLITRRGKIVASIQPSVEAKTVASLKPWERLRGTAECRFEAGESVLKDEDFEALR